MDFPGLRRHLLAMHPLDPQRQARIERALAQAEESLGALASLGHLFHLAEGSGEAFPEFPRRVFHVDAAPNGRLVYGEAELAELGPGWYDTLEKAQFADGLDTQFMGRGGVNRKGLPAILQTLSLAEVIALATEAAANKQKRIEEFKASMKNAQ